MASPKSLILTPAGRAELHAGELVVDNAEGQVSVTLSPAQLRSLEAAQTPAATREIERKLLVSRLPESLSLARFESARLRQGYLLIASEASLRIRDKKGRTRLTLKRGKGMDREEVEIELDPTQAAKLWPLAAARTLEKVRYLVPDQEGWLELDVYEGPLDGLMTVEREFSTRSEAKQWTPPPWVGQDVTEDARYTNARLVLQGAPRPDVST